MTEVLGTKINPPAKYGHSGLGLWLPSSKPKHDASFPRKGQKVLALMPESRLTLQQRATEEAPLQLTNLAGEP
jgi:hypothetical protein